MSNVSEELFNEWKTKFITAGFSDEDADMMAKVKVYMEMNPISFDKVNPIEGLKRWFRANF